MYAAHCVLFSRLCAAVASFGNSLEITDTTSQLGSSLTAFFSIVKPKTTYCTTR